MTTTTPQRYEFSDGKSDKFWTIELSGSSHTVSYGRIGTNGQTKTKDFDSDDDAKSSYDKLIAQKVKKGYVKVGAEEAAAPAKKSASTDGTATVAKKASAKKSSKKAAKKKTASAATKTADASKPATDKVVLDVTDCINLDAEFLRYATWEEHPVLRSPATAPDFDEAACMGRVAQLKVDRYGWDWGFEKVNFNGISKTEALFWTVLMTMAHGRESPRFTAKKALKDTKKFDGNLSPAELKGLVNSYQRTVPAEFVKPLSMLLELDELLDFLLEPFEPEFNSRAVGYSAENKAMEISSQFAIGFNRWVLPTLGKTQRKAVEQRIKPLVKSINEPTDLAFAFAPEVYLAAGLGLHRELESLVSSWDDKRYSEPWVAHYQQPQYIVLGLSSPEVISAEWRRLGLHMLNVDHLSAFIGATRLCALDVVVDSIVSQTNKAEAAKFAKVLAKVESPAAALPMLRLKLESKAPTVGVEWLDRFVVNGVHGLVPVAGGRDKLADAAMQYLQDVKRKGHAVLIQRALADQDAAVVDKIRGQILDKEEKELTPFDDDTAPSWLSDGLQAASGKKPLKWPDVDILASIEIGDHQLNPAQLQALLVMLKNSSLEDGDPLFVALKQHANRDSLDAFGWRLFELWTEQGAPSKEKWAMQAIGFLGNDNSALKLTPMIRTWPGESQHRRAVVGLECLRAIGSDTALMQLNGISQKVKFQGIKKQARAFMEAIAKGRGMTREQLEDRVVPDLDLNERGTREFDFGTRTFTFVLPSDMKPAVKDEDGKIRKDLPKPAAKDDKDKAEAAVADWKLLKKQFRETIKIQVPRLEQSMVTGRRWSVDEFESLLVKHPLMTNFVRTLLWGGFTKAGKLKTTFRVTDEQDYADASDEPLELQGVESVGIVHPLMLTAKQASAWGEIFSDYEIASPFPQLGRDTHKLEPGEAKTKTLDRYNDVEISPMTLVGTLDRLGWIRGTPLDGGVFHEHSKPFYGANVTAVVEYEEGVPVGYMDGWDDQKLRGCYFLPGLSGSGWDYPDSRRGLVLEKVDEIVISEVLSDLALLASKAN